MYNQEFGFLMGIQVELSTARAETSIMRIVHIPTGLPVKLRKTMRRPLCRVIMHVPTIQITSGMSIPPAAIDYKLYHYNVFTVD